MNNTSEIIYSNFEMLKEYLQKKTNCTKEEAIEYANMVYDLYFDKGVPTKYSVATIIKVVRDEQNKNRKSEETIW